MAPGMSYSRLQNATPGSFVYFGNKAKSSSSAMSFLGAYSTKNRNSAKKTFPSPRIVANATTAPFGGTIFLYEQNGCVFAQTPLPNSSTTCFQYIESKYPGVNCKQFGATQPTTTSSGAAATECNCCPTPVQGDY